MIQLSVDDSLQEANRRLAVGESESAEKLVLEVLAANRDDQAALMLLSRTQQARGDYDAMLETAYRLVSKAPGDLEIQLRLAECMLHCSEVAQSLELVREIEQAAGTNADVLQRVGAFWVQCERHVDGFRVYDKVMRLFPDASQAVYNTALSRLFLGDIEEAESLFERVLQLDPDHHHAWLNRSMLRRQTPGSNHVTALERALSRLPEKHEGRIPLHYALAKELEDLEEFNASFRHLQSGASERKRRLSYDVAMDEEAMQSIMATFPAPITGNCGVGYESSQPLLVLGLPRSGTTLVERILACHSQVASLGEAHTLPYALVHTVGPHRDRRELIERSACCDFTRLGERYVRGLTGFGESAERLVDKTPFNLLYLGVIRRALPNARVIHLRRDPMDSCYAMYKTLFHSGYPFSYSLQDVGRFTIAYHRLMEHWRTIMPGWFLDLDYETLVTDTETQVRKLLDFLGLPFEAACMSPHKLTSPVATASASQVRQPIYRSSVQRWRSYERQLAPLARKLHEAGLPVR